MYSTFIFHDDICSGDLARMLKTVLVRMDVEGCRFDYQGSVGPEASHVRFDVEDSTQLTKAVNDSKYIDQSVKESVIIEIQEGDELPLITVLVPEP